MTDTVRIKLAVLVTLVLQSVAIAYYIGTAKVTIEKDVETCIADLAAESDNVEKLESKVDVLIKTVTRLEVLLEERK